MYREVARTRTCVRKALLWYLPIPQLAAELRRLAHEAHDSDTCSPTEEGTVVAPGCESFSLHLDKFYVSASLKGEKRLQRVVPDSYACVLQMRYLWPSESKRRFGEFNLSNMQSQRVFELCIFPLQTP